MSKRRTISDQDTRREHAQHQVAEAKRLFTRRQFLGRGIQAATATVALPTFIDLLLRPSVAHAAIGFNGLITFDLAGGASWTPEFVMTKVTGEYLPRYDRLGREEDRTAANITTEYGAPIWRGSILGRALAGESAEINGVVYPGATAAVRAALKIALICNPNNQDDSGNNLTLATHAAAQLAARLEAAHQISTGVSTARSVSGGNSRSALEIASFRPATVTSLSTFQNLLNLKQAALAGFSNQQVGAFARLLSRLNTAQKERLKSLEGGKQLGLVAESAGREIAAKAETVVAFDPRTDARIAPYFGLTPTSNQASNTVVTASGVKLLLDGHTPHFVQTFGGYDYHDATATTWKERHREAIYRTMATLNACAAAGKPVLLHWNTDGAVFHDPGTEIARGDANEHHTAVLFALSIGGAPQLQRFQIGGFTDNQAAAGNTPVAEAPQNEGHAVFANVAAFQGIADIRSVAPENFDRELFASFNLFKR